MPMRDEDKEVLFRYLDENPEDEISEHLTGEGWDKVRRGWKFAPGYGSVVVHHIYRGATGGRYHIWPLLISVDPISHQFLHMSPQHGLVACLWLKICKKKEYDRELVRSVVGRDPVGVVKNWVDTGELMHPYYVELAKGVVSEYDES